MAQKSRPGHGSSPDDDRRHARLDHQRPLVEGLARVEEDHIEGRKEGCDAFVGLGREIAVGVGRLQDAVLGVAEVDAYAFRVPRERLW